MFLFLANLFASPNCPSTALWRTGPGRKPAQSSGPCPLVLLPVCPRRAGRHHRLQLLKDRSKPGRCRGAQLPGWPACAVAGRL